MHDARPTTDIAAPSGASRAPTASRRRTFALMIAAVFLYWVALYIYVPTLPTYVQSKTADLATVGVVLAQYGLWQAVVRLPLGIVSDWLGRRKPFVIGGLLLTGLGAWMLGAASGEGGLIAGRAVTGLACGTWVPLIVLFSGMFPPHEAVKAAALLTLVGSVGKVLATGVNGSLIALGGYTLPFFLAAGLGALAALVAIPIPEGSRPATKASLSSSLRICIRRDVMLPSLLNMVAQYANFAATFGFFPILAKRMGAGNVAQSLLVSGNLAVVMLGNLVASAIASRVGAQRLVALSFASLAAGLVVAAVAPSLPLLIVAQLLVGVCQGIGYPVLMGLSIRDVGEAQRSTAMGLHQSVYAIGMFAGPWLSGILADAMGVQPMFAVTAAGCLALGLLGARLLAKRADPTTC